MRKTRLHLNRCTSSGISAGLLLFVLALAFSIPPAHAQTVTVLNDYGITATDGFWPELDALAPGRLGYLHSSTCYGGTNNAGAAFKISPTGARTLLHSFNGTDGSCPAGGLALGTDNNLYGTAGGGGTFGDGTIYKMDVAGNVTVLYNFTGGSDGAGPVGTLIQDTDGNFYGTATAGGSTACSGGCGTVYKITPSGVFTLLHEFDGTDGDDPRAPLVQATDGKFYGTTIAGGTLSWGVVFKMTATGTFKVIHNFDFASGANPYSPVIQASDGNLYGTTYDGGPRNGYHGDGVIYRLSTEGAFTLLHSFYVASDGGEPFAGLVQATDGNLYGANPYGGTHGKGTLYSISLDGTFSVLYNFDGTTGQQSETTPFQKTDGAIYGETLIGGTGTACSDGTQEACGVFYSLSVGLSPFVSFLPAQRSGRVGQTIQIFGQGLTGATGVSFNGTAASFSIVEDTFMTAVVPSGATTGFLTVATPSGTLTSNVAFRVIP